MSSPGAVVAAVAGVETTAAALVVPVALALWSTAAVPAAVDRPAYSSTATPRSALALGVAVIVGIVPPPAVTGALQMLISVLSEALKCCSSVKVSPAESLTLEAVALALLQTPTSTTRRLPETSLAPGVTPKLVTLGAWPEACCTNCGEAVPDGVTAFDAAEAGPLPMALVAVTVNV